MLCKGADRLTTRLIFLWYSVYKDPRYLQSRELMQPAKAKVKT